MAHCSVTRRVTADAARVWALLRAFDDLTWIPGAGTVDVEGDGPGMRRHIAAGGSSIVERLVSIDDETRTLAYSIDEDNPLPVTRYEAVATVEQTENGSTITWAVDFDAADEDAAIEGIEAIYDLMAGWLQDAAEGSG